MGWLGYLAEGRAGGDPLTFFHIGHGRRQRLQRAIEARLHLQMSHLALDQVVLAPELFHLYALRVELGPLRLRSEEHTSELQSLRHLVCRLLLEKKKTQNQQ